MKIKALKRNFAILLSITLIGVGLQGFIIKKTYDKNHNSAIEIEELHKKNEQLQQYIMRLKQGKNYDYLIKLLKSDLSQDMVYSNITNTQKLDSFLTDIAHKFRITDLQIFLDQRFEVLDRFSLNQWQIECTKIPLKINMNTLLEEQLIFFLSKLDDLLVKKNVLYNLNIDNIDIENKISEIDRNVKLESNKHLKLDGTLYFFNIIKQ